MEKGSFNGKPFAALALGLMGRGTTGEGAEAVKTAIRTAVRYEFVNYKGAPTNRGALALALGLLRDAESAESLIRVLEDRGNDKKLRGFTAIALGLIKDQRASEAILKSLDEKADRDLRVDTAVAAGLLGDSTAVEKLVAILNDKDASLFVQGSVSLALGAIGDSRAIDPLTTICLDEKVPDLNRALAAVALGNLGDRNDHSVLSRLSKDVNYRATVNSLVEVLSIL
jgi:HEAT repeat protein